MVTGLKGTEIINISPRSEIMPDCLKSDKLDKPRYNTHRDDHRPVSFLMESEVFNLIDAAKNGRHGDRDSLLLEVTFKCALRISETLALTPSCRARAGANYVLLVKHGKGDKPRVLGINRGLYETLGSYALDNGMNPDDRYFKFTRFRALQIIKSAAIKSGIDNRRIYNHLLRHSGALARLKRTGNIESLKQFLGHTDHAMTERYLRTMQTIESIEIESQVTFER
jgi:site-specific recombinase XerD